jgi:hypothetical protein
MTEAEVQEQLEQQAKKWKREMLWDEVGPWLKAIAVSIVTFIIGYFLIDWIFSPMYTAEPENAARGAMVFARLLSVSAAIGFGLGSFDYFRHR